MISHAEKRGFLNEGLPAGYITHLKFTLSSPYMQQDMQWAQLYSARRSGDATDKAENLIACVLPLHVIMTGSFSRLHSADYRTKHRYFRYPALYLCTTG
jgi:hypothetical protein